jgi:hypothetical protein
MDSSYRETKKKGYDNMGPEMYDYRVTELRSSDSYRSVAGTTGRTLLLRDNTQETRLVHAVDDMDTVGLLVALSRPSCAAHTSAVLTALCWLQDFDLQRYLIRLLKWRRQDIVCAGLRGIQAHIKFIRNLITCVTIVPSVSQFIPAIRTCRRALSKYTLG